AAVAPVRPRSLYEAAPGRPRAIIRRHAAASLPPDVTYNDLIRFASTRVTASSRERLDLLFSTGYPQRRRPQ
ncbi:MAG: hypothetical protein JWP75_3038, partial [Frondihabitans sp.]|nr:hypothetical protein [Frondihabitans sp.]